MCWSLAAIGVGKISILDFDIIEESNLNRQLLYTPKDLGKPKVDVLREKIQEFNPQIEVISLNQKITSQSDVEKLLPNVDLLVKAIDTPEASMEWVNSACVTTGTPYVAGGFLDSVGVVGPNYLPGKSTCFACHGFNGDITRLHGTGATFAPLVTLVSSMLSMISYKILIDEAENLLSKTFTYTPSDGMWHTEPVVVTERCDVCGHANDVNIDQNTPIKKIWAYRIPFIAILLLTLILQQFFNQPLVGILTFFGLLLSIPIIKNLNDGDPAKTRREFFVLSCIYVAFSLTSITIGNLLDGLMFIPNSLTTTLSAIRSVSTLTIQGALSITIIFLLLCGILEYAPKIAAFLNEDIS